MKLTPADIPGIREKWVAARTAKRRSHFRIERAKSQIERGRVNENALPLREYTFDEIMARGVMQMLAKLRLQQRHMESRRGAGAPGVGSRSQS